MTQRRTRAGTRDPLRILQSYTPMERAVLAAYLPVPDPQPADLAGIDVTRPVPSRWSERKNGIGPQPSLLDGNPLLLENAVARICLDSVQRSLPQWAVIRDGEVELGRNSKRTGGHGRALEPVHLFTINWADSAPGFSWPEAYYLTPLIGYGVSVVTASADSPDLHGYCDIAVGSYTGAASNLRRAGSCIQQYWTSLRSDHQERWAYLFGTGAFDQRGANKLADAVWTEPGGDE